MNLKYRTPKPGRYDDDLSCARFLAGLTATTGGTTRKTYGFLSMNVVCFFFSFLYVFVSPVVWHGGVFNRDLAAWFGTIIRILKGSRTYSTASLPLPLAVPLLSRDKSTTCISERVTCRTGNHLLNTCRFFNPIAFSRRSTKRAPFTALKRVKDTRAVFLIILALKMPNPFI